MPMSAKSKRVMSFEDGIDIEGYGCRIKRLVHPQTVGSQHVALAVAVAQSGQEIKSHRHAFEEAYFVAQGKARMRGGDEEFDVRAWDAFVVPPNVEHWTLNTGDDELVLVCALAPPPPAK